MSAKTEDPSRGGFFPKMYSILQGACNCSMTQRKRYAAGRDSSNPTARELSSKPKSDLHRLFFLLICDTVWVD